MVLLKLGLIKTSFPLLKLKFRHRLKCVLLKGCDLNFEVNNFFKHKIKVPVVITKSVKLLVIVITFCIDFKVDVSFVATFKI